MSRILILIIVFEFSFLFVSGQEDWKLKLDKQEDWKLEVDKEGIKIYSCPFSESRIKALRVVCTLEARLSQMAAVLLDITEQDQWFYHTKSSLLHRVSLSELFYYSEVSLPWPFSNRDYIAHLRISQNPATKIITMDEQNVPDFVPPKKNIVRVTHSFCQWVVTPTGKNVISIEFTLFADPAGYIRPWLINMFSTWGPFETFKKLKTHIKKPEYNNVRLPFIED
jgi:START domain